MSRPSPPRAAYVAWLAICTIWGTSYLAIKIALETLPPMLITGSRYALAGGLLLGWLAATRRRLPPRAAWPGMVMVGFLMLSLGNGLLVAAELYVPSGLTAVLVATTPFWMVGVDAVQRGGDRLTLRHWAGLALGFAGILLLVWGDVFTPQGFSWRFAAGVVALQFACLSWSIGSVIGRRQAIAISPFSASAVQMLTAGLIVLVASLLVDDWTAVRVTWRSGLALAYLAIFASLIAFVAYTYALMHLSTSFVSLYAYINPIVAVILGAVAAGEPFGLQHGVAIAIILGATAVVSTAPSRDDAVASPRGPGAAEPVVD